MSQAAAKRSHLPLRRSNIHGYYRITTPTITAYGWPERELGEWSRLDIKAPEELKAVLMESPKTQRRAVWTMATYFRREFEYDGVQYGHEGKDDDREATAFLFTSGADHENKEIVFGACCFRYRRYSDGSTPGWALQWIWMHPYARSKGILSSAWPLFRKRFGNFAVERPLSQAMDAFMKSRKS